MSRVYVILIFLFSNLVSSAHCPLSALQTTLKNPLYQDQLDVVLAAGLNEKLLAWPVADLDARHREAVADAIKKLGEPAWRRLYVELPETRAAMGVQGEYTAEDRLQRARNLARLNRSELVIETLKPDVGTLNCDVYFLMGQAERRQRNYQAAKNWLLPVIEKCDGDIKREAFFISARLAAMNSSTEALVLLDNFLKQYPEHSYADDVLLWKISVLSDLGSNDDVEHAYSELFEKYPIGDQISNATFRQAFAWAKKGRVKDAIERLSKGPQDDRAVYWSGRLLLSHDLTSEKLSEDEVDRLRGIEILSQLAQSKPNSYYGYLAQHWLEKRIAVKKTAEVINVKASDALLANPKYQEAQKLIRRGCSVEAMMFLNDLDRSNLLPADRVVLAKDFKRIHRLDRSHQVMRAVGLTEPMSLAFPQAYGVEIKDATKRAHLPPYLLFGLAREESTFDADVVSWAGAYGLCQLMPTVGKEEARKAKLKHFETSSLLDPKINARLGAQHFAQQLKDLGHPLLAIAAYNGGAPSVKRWKDRSPAGGPIDVFVEEIPFEQTRNYVKRVTSSWLTYAFLADQLEKVKFPFRLQ